MVSALFRHISKNDQATNRLARERLVDSIISAGNRIERSTSFPYALREFVNSVADLPTIEELVAQSEPLARAMKSAS